MATHDNRYSRVVAWLKVLLPVMALILLSTMFLISRSIDPGMALTYAQIDLEGLARDQRLTGPRFSGVTQDGAAISFSAETAQPDPENAAIYSANDLKAQIETPDGGIVDIQAGIAVIDNAQNILDLTAGVSLTTSTHYNIQTQGLRAKMDIAWIESLGAISAVGPIGKFTAGQMHMTRQTDVPGSYVLVFKGGVKVVYVPNSNKEE